MTTEVTRGAEAGRVPGAAERETRRVRGPAIRVRSRRGGARLVSDLMDRVMLVKKLREVRVLESFSRITPPMPDPQLPGLHLLMPAPDGYPPSRSTVKACSLPSPWTTSSPGSPEPCSPTR